MKSTGTNRMSAMVSITDGGWNPHKRASQQLFTICGVDVDTLAFPQQIFKLNPDVVFDLQM